jgi:hypothetical protein
VDESSAGPGARRGPSEGPELTPEQVWERLWSEARYDLRLSDAEFLALTPRQFSLLRKRRDAEHERQELLFGIISQNIVNFSMSRPKDPAKASDFMPSRWGRPESDEDILVRLDRELSSGATKIQG